MATQRYISTSFWDDSWVRSLKTTEKLLYLYLMTNPLTNIAGVYKLTIDRIVFDTSINAQNVKRAIDKFSKDGKAYFYNEYIILPSWPKHQKWQQKSKIKTGIECILKELDGNMLGYLDKIGYTYPINTLNIEYTYQPNYSDSDLDSDTDIDSDTDTDKKPKFQKPQQQQFDKYCKEIGWEGDYCQFFDYYESKDWMIGKSRMKDWKATVRNWKRRDQDRNKETQLRPVKKIPEFTNCPSCGSKDLIKTINTVQCRSCREVYELVDGKWRVEETA